MPSTSQRQSWRTAKPLPQQPKRVTRVVLTIVALLLMGALVWLLIPPLEQTHVVALPVIDYEAIDVPPIGFVGEDVAGLAVLDDLWKRGEPPGPVVLSGLEVSRELRANLTGELKKVVARPKDSLIFYVSAHGVSRSGDAWLLCSDFDPTQTDAGRLKASELLASVKACPGVVKLVVLDTGGIVADARLAMLANEFPRLLGSAVKATNDPSLWVFTSHDIGETSQPASGLRRSRFSYLVTAGLNGLAESNGDRQIDLAELYDYVTRELARWTALAGGGEQSQTPVLLHGGAGRVTAASSGIVLLPARRVTSTTSMWRELGPQTALAQQSASPPPAQDTAAPQSPATDKPPAEKPAAETKTTPETKAAPETKTPAETNAPPPQPAPPAEKPAPQAEAQGLLAEAWRMRDDLFDRAKHDWSPVDYAPHLAREFQELVLAYEQRLRAGNAYKPAEIADRLRKNILPLSEMLRGDSPGDNSTIAQRLARAWHQFNASDLRRRYDFEPRYVRQAIRLRNDAAFRTVDYVRLVGRSAASSGGDDTLADDLRKLLPALDALSRRLDAIQSADAALRSDLVRIGDALQFEDRQLRELLTTIDAALADEARRLADEPRQQAAAIESLLASTLPTASAREKLLASLPRSESTPDFKDRAPAVRAQQPAIGQRRWDALRQQAELELGLLRWAGIDPTGSDRKLDNPADDAARWSKLAEFGSGLEAAYRDLPGKINKGFADSRRLGPTEQVAARQPIERWLRLVDARDAKRVDESVNIAPLPPRATEVRLTIQAPPKLDVRDDEWTPLEFKLQSGAGRPAEVWAKPEFDSALLEARLADHQELLAAGRRSDRPTLLDDRGAGSITFQLRAKQRGVASTVAFKVSFQSDGAQAAPASVAIGMPAPERIDLLAHGTTGTVISDGARQETWIADADDRLQLLPFPNRTTTFHLALANRSDRSQKVGVALLTAPAAGPGARGDLPLNPLDWEDAGARTVASIKEMTLGVGGQPVPIAFPAPAAPAPAAAATPAAPGAGAPPAGEPKKDRTPIAAGLLCVVTDLAHPERRWIKRIDVAVQRPENYLEAEASYDRIQGRINVVLRPCDFDNDGRPDVTRLPPKGAAVVWDVADLKGAAMQAESEVTAPQYEARLFADLTPEAPRDVDVRLTVDGYPRAFVWRIQRANSQNHLRPRSDLRQVRIVAPHNGDAFRAPRDTLPVELQVDAPADAFRDAGDVLEVGVDPVLDRSLRDDRPQRFYGDRQLELWVDDLGPDGLLKIDAQVHDFKVNLDPHGLRNTTVEVGAQLSIRGTDPIATFVGVVLDATPPRIDVATDPPGAVLTQGRDLIVIVTDADPERRGNSDITMVEAAFNKLDKPVAGAQSPDGRDWRVVLPTQDLKPGKYPVLVRATDRVELQSSPERLIATVLPPVDPSKNAPRPENSIVGSVTISGTPQANVTVVLSGGASAAARTDARGAFEFRNLKPGAYKLSAKGIVRNREYAAKPLDVTVQPAPAPPTTAALDLE